MQLLILLAILVLNFQLYKLSQLLLTIDQQNLDISFENKRVDLKEIEDE